MKICIATGTRAEYGLLKPLIDQIMLTAKYELQLLVTGAHLSPEFGLTYRLIEEDGLKINAKVEMLLSSDTSEGIVKSMGLGMIGFADALKNLQPDLIFILGDRYEMLALASAAVIFKIPIAHLHGGEITEGAYDDAIRHSITKMSTLHFTSTEEYRQRVIQMGEQPEMVFNVGAIGLDNIINLPLLTKEALAESLNVSFKKYNYLVTFHPETLSEQSVVLQFEILLDVINKDKDGFFIFTHANADTDGRVINKMIDAFVAQNPGKAVAFTTMGQLRYLSAMKYATGVIGNSSSGIIESASFKVPTVNIGDRQKGRIYGENVINVGVNKEEIERAFVKIKDEQYLLGLREIRNPYGIGNTSKEIMTILQKIDGFLPRNKTFYNIENEHAS
ncbi:UDP-N-acetylglucosamine 2-epimerase [Pedobacter steynii]|uniref:UDP-N-acetyl-D-glucosamine 2-epimerase, UDP-hydrolysing n=1 Tax=Pedobacter steynii TaxID=430522 RepID=A0A1D7QE01_9SPHI|nr:UDP-N-acetylglucosamine 2-epimerase [Pedobacter steynii]AOM76912.1 UDP-N-acetyl-D-glucosamine 2-epimerase, UDP-hydrolysing [Pedobacter steynii]